MNVAGTKKWDGTKWVPVNVKRDGQRATRNGKPVIRRNGEWVPYSSSTRSRRSHNNRTRTQQTKPPTSTPLREIPASERPADMQAGKVYGDAGQPPAPTLPPRPRPTPTRTTQTKPTEPTKTRKPQDKGDMSANMRAWAKAHPELAKKVKKGQSGYKSIQRSADPSSSTPTANKPKNRSSDWISNNFTPGNKPSKTKPADTRRKKNRSASWIARNYNK
jgi:hypothetical protein